MNRKTTMNTTLTALGLAAAAGLVMLTMPANAGADPIDGFGVDELEVQEDAYSFLPNVIELTGTVRDFRERNATHGHPDFEKKPTGGFGHYVNMVQDTLGADGKPVFRSTGQRIGTQWRDSQGRNIIPPREYITAAAGDQAGSLNNNVGALTTEENFGDWFRDKPGKNVSMALPITLRRNTNTNLYTFDDREDPTFTNLGGFFPLNGQLFGNSAGNDKNFHFTFDLATEFVYEQGAGQSFTFTGDDDVWVYVDNKLVIDIGGVHSRVAQTIELDRLEWLQDGQKYPLNFFFAERHRTQSNFRIETTMTLRNAELPTTAAMFD